MVSINTSSTGMASAALRSINAQLATTQNRIATGYRVNSAADDASLWATATKIRSDKSGSEALKSGALTAKAQADAGIAALDEFSKLLESARSIVVTANGASTAADVAKVNGLMTQAVAIINGASVGGKNVLTTGSLSAIVNVSEGVTTNTTVTQAAEGMLAFASGAYTSTDYMGVLNTQTTTTLNATSTFVAAVTTAQTAIGLLGAKLGAYSAGIDSSMSFLDKLNDIRETAIGALVDADLEKESAKLSALQVKQQLAYQALSMGNASSQNILRLFQ